MQNIKILPMDATESVRVMIDITERLCELMDDERYSVAVTDGNTFVAANEEKQKLADIYEQAAGEFRKRLNEFRGVEPDLLDHLDQTQKKLKELTSSNMDILETVAPTNSR
ncbi:MAG: hypothetical protein JWO78_1544 [Micavibrio sp.]|nr:hypothetical protein [Micavibrio sp.]